MRNLQLDAFTNYKFLSAVKYAPGGKAAAFVVSQADLAENAYESSIYLYEGDAIRRLTGLGKESSFTWLDENRLIFPAVRSAAEKKRAEAGDPFTAYYMIDIHGGEAVPFLTLPFSARKILPLDEDHFAVLGAIDVNHPDLYKASEDERKEVVAAYKEDRDYEVLDESPFWFNGAGVVNKRRTALFLVSRNNKASAAECPAPADCKTETGSSTAPASSLDIVRMTKATENVGQLELLHDELLYSASDFTACRPSKGFSIDALNRKTREVRRVFEDAEMDFGGLIVSDDIVYLQASECKRFGRNENSWVYTLNVQSGELKLVREEEFSMYGSVGSDCRYGGGSGQFLKGSTLYHLTTREGDSLLYKLEADGSSVPVITKPGSIDCFTMAKEHDTVLLIALYDMHLQELYAYENGVIRRLSHFNDAALEDVYVAEPEFLETESEGLTIGGWVLKPKDYDPAQKYPAVFDIHGGPKTAYGPVFYHEMQYWANEGYFVFFCNPKGSDGRDNTFADIRGEYGQTDYRNLMAFADAVLEAYPAIDPSRVCETGGSYGGFMTNWIIGHTDRFAATASQRSISNWVSFYGVSDIGPTFSADQTAGDPFEAMEKMWEQSPLKYADQVRTPTLFIHSDEDYRCPLEQGLQMYTALVRHNVPARLVMFHGENHELSRSGKPKHRIRRLTEITEWFNKYAK